MQWKQGGDLEASLRFRTRSAGSCQRRALAPECVQRRRCGDDASGMAAVRLWQAARLARHTRYRAEPASGCSEPPLGGHCPLQEKFLAPATIQAHTHSCDAPPALELIRGRHPCSKQEGEIVAPSGEVSCPYPGRPTAKRVITLIESEGVRPRRMPLLAAGASTDRRSGAFGRLVRTRRVPPPVEPTHEQYRQRSDRPRQSLRSLSLSWPRWEPRLSWVLRARLSLEPLTT